MQQFEDDASLASKKISGELQQAVATSSAHVSESDWDQIDCPDMGCFAAVAPGAGCHFGAS